MTELIKTQKQYEETLDFLKINRFAYDEANEIEDLIEALRRFVRASDAVETGVVDFDLHKAQVDELRDSRAALPDWIKEDG